MDRYTKAIVAALMAGLGALGTAFADGHVTATEWVVVAGAAVAGLTAVWAAPANTVPASRPGEEGEQK